MGSSLLVRGVFCLQSGWEKLGNNSARTRKWRLKSFKKCGISVAADGSEDFEIHLEGLDNY